MSGPSSHRILVVDDDLSMRQFLQILLQREGYEVRTDASAEAALQSCASWWPDLVLTDLNMPGMSGMELLSEVKTLAVQRGQDVEVVMVTAYATTESAIEALQRGARDYVRKPFNNDELKLTIRRALAQHVLEQENLRLKAEVQDQLHFGCLIGSSAPMQAVYDMVRRVKDTPINCLLLGESGTGKELVARAIHTAGVRSGQFVAVNCGAIPENLVESELFGHVKGAFTGAARDKQGLVAAAHQGTLFLDEVNSLPLTAQVKLLRVLQERKVLPVGATREVGVDLRVIAAANEDLEALVRAGDFREDLYYRINVVQFALPPLRQRLDDLPELLRFFVRRYAEEYGKPVRGLSPRAVGRLRRWDWPGNVRELQNTVARAVALSDGELIEPGDLPTRIAGQDSDLGWMAAEEPQAEGGLQLPAQIPAEGLDFELTMANVEKYLLSRALEASDGNKTRAARLLQLSFRSFRYRLAKHDLDAGG